MIGITCVCLTYGRPRVLEEAIESYLRQDYEGPSELLVVNDYDGQELVCDAPGVKVLNWPDRVTPLGRKYNQSIDFAEHGHIAVWEDDDIFLPNRLRCHAEAFAEGAQHHHTGQAFFEHKAGELVKANNLHHSALAFTWGAWHFNGHYTEADADHCSLDRDFMERLGVIGNSVTLPWEDVYYIYRWQHTGSYHGSGLGTDISARAAQWVKDSKPEHGRIELKPHWSRDWVALAEHARKES